MPDEVRNEAELLAAFADNETNDISAQDMRDFVVSIPELVEAELALKLDATHEGAGGDAHSLAGAGVGDDPPVDGFMSGSDWLKLDGIEPGAQVNAVTRRTTKIVSDLAYTLLDSDFDKLLVCTVATAITVPAGLTAGGEFFAIGASDAITFVGGVGMTLSAAPTYETTPIGTAGAVAEGRIILRTATIGYVVGNLALA